MTVTKVVWPGASYHREGGFGEQFYTFLKWDCGRLTNSYFHKFVVLWSSDICAKSASLSVSVVGG